MRTQRTQPQSCKWATDILQCFHPVGQYPPNYWATCSLLQCLKRSDGDSKGIVSDSRLSQLGNQLRQSTALFLQLYLLFLHLARLRQKHRRTGISFPFALFSSVTSLFISFMYLYFPNSIESIQTL